jgi:hypothetical protein
MNRRKILITIVAVVGLALLTLYLYRQNAQQFIPGVDANGDGIRDDVERLIEQKYSYDPKIRIAVRELAKSVQTSIVDPNHPNGQQDLFVVDCLHYVAGDKSTEILTEIEFLTANTSARARNLYKESARFSGTMLRGARSKAEACAYNPELLK